MSICAIVQPPDQSERVHSPEHTHHNHSMPILPSLLKASVQMRAILLTSPAKAIELRAHRDVLRCVCYVSSYISIYTAFWPATMALLLHFNWKGALTWSAQVPGAHTYVRSHHLPRCGSTLQRTRWPAILHIHLSVSPAVISNEKVNSLYTNSEGPSVPRKHDHEELDSRKLVYAHHTYTRMNHATHQTPQRGGKQLCTSC